MSALGDQASDKRDRKRRGRRQAVAVADWASVDHAILIQAICTVGSIGGALRFGYSRDGGAYSIGVYGDGEPYTLWVRPGDADELNQTLLNLTEDFAA